MAYLLIATVWFSLSLVYFSVCLCCVTTANINFAWYRSLELKLKSPCQEFRINDKRTNRLFVSFKIIRCAVTVSLYWENEECIHV